MDEIKINVMHNKEIYDAYNKNLEEIDFIRVLEFDESEQTSYKNIVVEVLQNPFFSRDELESSLNEENILARRHYSPALHTKEYKYKTEVKDMTYTPLLEKNLLNLPCGSRVKVADVKLICDFIKSLSVGSR